MNTFHFSFKCGRDGVFFTILKSGLNSSTVFYGRAVCRQLARWLLFCDKILGNKLLSLLNGWVF